MARGLTIEPLTAARFDALETLFREGGDPRWCWYQLQVGTHGRLAQP
jgi:hypothetical protein